MGWNFGNILERDGTSLHHTFGMRQGMVPKCFFGRIIGIVMVPFKIDIPSCFDLLETKVLEFLTVWNGYMARHIGDLFLFETLKTMSWSLWLSIWMICMLHRLVHLVVISWFGSLSGAIFDLPEDTLLRTLSDPLRNSL